MSCIYQMRIIMQSVKISQKRTLSSFEDSGAALVVGMTFATNPAGTSCVVNDIMWMILVAQLSNSAHQVFRKMTWPKSNRSNKMIKDMTHPTPFEIADLISFYQSDNVNRPFLNLPFSIFLPFFVRSCQKGKRKKLQRRLLLQITCGKNEQVFGLNHEGNDENSRKVCPKRFICEF